MKNLLKIVSIIGLTIMAHTAYTAEITDTYNTGDTLTATTLETIKSAVNDNNTRINAAGPFINTRAPTATDDINDPNAYPVGSVWVDTTANTTYTLTDNAAGIAVWKLITALTVYAIGDIGPAGGWVFYVDAEGRHGLEAAPTDQSTGIRWFNGVDTNTEANGDGLGAGEMNTMLIIASQGSDSNTYAAGISANLVITSAGVDYGDWYLPSRYEVNLMFLNIGKDSIDNVGSFAIFGAYWSSSENSTNSVWLQGFDGGGQSNGSKNSTHRVRAVRAF